MCSSHDFEATVLSTLQLYVSMLMLVQLYGVIMDDIH